MTTPNTRSRGLVSDAGLVYAAAIWGATFFVVKNALSGVDALVLVSYRFLIAGALLLMWLAFKRKLVLRDLRPAAIMAVLLWLLYVPQTVGLKYTTASNSGFITGLFVAFVPALMPIILKYRPGWVDVLASLVSLAGLWVLTGGMTEINRGDLLTLLTALAYAAHLLTADKYMKRGLDPLVAACQQFLLVGLLSLLTALLVRRPLTISTGQAAWAVLFLALFPSLSAFVIQMIAQRVTAPVKVSLIFALEPVFAAVFAWTLGGEEFIPRHAAGGLLIFAALVLAGFSKAGTEKPSTRGFDPTDKIQRGNLL